MKTSIKILLLLVALLVCVGAVLIFQKTIMQPPLKMSTADQYKPVMKAKIEKFKNVSSDSLEAMYFNSLDFANRLHENQKIDDEKFFDDVSDIVAIYSPRFSDWCFAVFNQSDWKANDISFMNSRIADLLNFNINGSSVLANGDKVELHDISDIIKQYEAAKSLASSTGFSSVTNAKDKIAKAKEYAAMDPLKNNTGLVNSLNALPQKIEQNHYKNVLAQVQKLLNYTRYSEAEYDRLHASIKQEIRDYASAASNVYHHSSDVSHLESLLSNYYHKGLDYFDNYSSASSSSSSYDDWY